MEGDATFLDPITHTLKYRIEILMPNVQQIHSLDHMDGNVGNEIPMPSLGKDVKIRSKKQLKDAMSRARERYFEMTSGRHASLIPVKDERTGEIRLEKLTRETQGFDLGELHPVDKLEEQPEQRSPMDPNLSVTEHLDQLSKKLGEPMQHPRPSGT